VRNSSSEIERVQVTADDSQDWRRIAMFWHETGGTGMTTTPVVFWGRSPAPPFNGPLTISETTPGDVSTASFFDTSNNPVSQDAPGFLGSIIQQVYVEIGESTGSTDYYFLDGTFLENGPERPRPPLAIGFFVGPLAVR
jgi:hypothetical protein